MTTQYTPLSQTHLDENAILAHPETLPEYVHLEDPAINVMIDLSHEQFATIDVKKNFIDIDRLINTNHLSYFLVTKQKKVVGIISARDIHGSKPSIIHEQRNVDNEEINAEMLMTPRDEILILNYQDIKNAQVGHVWYSFKYYKKHYALIVESDEDTIQQRLELEERHQASKQTIRGLIIAAKLSAQLGEKYSILNY